MVTSGSMFHLFLMWHVWNLFLTHFECLFFFASANLQNLAILHKLAHLTEIGIFLVYFPEFPTAQRWKRTCTSTSLCPHNARTGASWSTTPGRMPTSVLSSLLLNDSNPKPKQLSPLSTGSVKVSDNWFIMDIFCPIVREENRVVSYLVSCSVFYCNFGDFYAIISHGFDVWYLVFSIWCLIIVKTVIFCMFLAYF